MKKFFKIVCLLVCIPSLNAQIGIGTNTPHNSASLEIAATDKGILIPKVALTSTASQSPIVNTPEESLLVYNTANVNDVEKGFYYWTGSAWQKLLADDNPKIKSLPWISTTTDLPDATNTTSIYHKGSVSIGTNTSIGKLTVVGEETDGEQESYFSKYSNATSDAVTLQFLKGRGTSYNAAAAVVDDDIIGTLNYRGVGAVSSGVPQYITLGRIQVTADGTVSTSSTPGRLEFWVERYTSDAENPELKMVLFEDGEVGVNKHSRWATDNTQTEILVVDNSGYFKTISSSSLRPAAPNQLEHLGNGYFLLKKADGTEENLMEQQNFNERQNGENDITAVDKILINLEEKVTSKFVPVHINKGEKDLSPLMVKNCPTFNTNDEAIKAGLEKGMIYRTSKGKLMIVF